MTSHDVKTCKMTSKRNNRRTDIMHESRLTFPHVRRYFLAPTGFMEIPVGYARNDLSALVKISENLFLHTRYPRFALGIEILGIKFMPKLHPFLEISTFQHIDVSFKSASFSLNGLLGYILSISISISLFRSCQ